MDGLEIVPGRGRALVKAHAIGEGVDRAAKIYGDSRTIYKRVERWAKDLAQKEGVSIEVKVSEILDRWLADYYE